MTSPIPLTTILLVLISPSESPEFRALGMSTWITENLGVDCAWVARGKWWGCQRKTLADLVASVADGRLAKERLQWHSLDHAYLLLETGERGGGAPRELPSTQLAGLGTYGRAWTGPQLRGLLYSLGVDGIQTICVKDEAETIARVVELEKWSKKARHSSATGRGQVPVDVFGQRDQRQYACWLLSSLPGVGSEMAGRIFDHYNGLPFTLREGIDATSLMQVRGVGKQTAKHIMDVFQEVTQ